MAKPPATPPSSDVEGPDEDRGARGRGAQAGHDAADDPGGRLNRRARETKARPPGTDHNARSTS